MNATRPLRVRRSIQELQDEYTAGNKKPLEDLWRAWAKIKELPPGDQRSFFTLGGYHGEPFRGPGKTNAQYWGGYCHHGNVLFPTWHRVYLLKLEDALRNVPGCGDVTMPYWDETSAESLAQGVPWALTQCNVELDGQTIPNPLRSFKFTADVVDSVRGQDSIYSKPEGYETVRYPLSGLVGTPDARTETDAHNADYPDYETNVCLLNQNITNWLAGTITIKGKPAKGHVAHNYKVCLDAPNYTVFSNETSSSQWNTETNANPPVVSVEQPHDSIHLAVGGYDVPQTLPGLDSADFSPIPGANADMGENDTAGLDPIFFFHHCFVDRVFWLWQKRHGLHLDIIPGYPGTNPWKVQQGPTPYLDPDKPLDLNTPLIPFEKENGEWYTSLDCVNIETQLQYTYGTGSLEEPSSLATAAPERAKVVTVSEINRAHYRGSFLISLFGPGDGSPMHLGTRAILSRWNVENCANCQTHLEVQAFFAVPPAGTGLMAAATEEALTETSSYHVLIQDRDGVKTPPLTYRDGAALSAAEAETGEQPLYRLRVR
jgi:tyrosinase